MEIFPNSFNSILFLSIHRLKSYESKYETWTLDVLMWKLFFWIWTSTISKSWMQTCNAILSSLHPTKNKKNVLNKDKFYTIPHKLANSETQPALWKGNPWTDLMSWTQPFLRKLDSINTLLKKSSKHYYKMDTFRAEKMEFFLER